MDACEPLCNSLQGMSGNLQNLASLSLASTSVFEVRPRACSQSCASPIQKMQRSRHSTNEAQVAGTNGAPTAMSRGLRRVRSHQLGLRELGTDSSAELGADTMAAQVEHLVRTFAGSEPPPSLSTARRFLVASHWALDAAEAMLRSHLQWRDSLPSEPSREVQRLLDSSRFRLLQGGSAPILLVDFKWGGFFNGGVDFDDAVASYIAALESIPSISCMEQAASRTDAKLTIVCIGGPPPLSYGRAISALFEANYPERLAQAIIYPVPSWVVRFINSVIAFLPVNVRHVTCSTEAELARALGFDGVLPNDIAIAINSHALPADQMPLSIESRMDCMERTVWTALDHADDELTREKRCVGKRRYSS